MEKLQKLISAYMNVHPRAENPMDHVMPLGPEGLIDILSKSNGRIIVFFTNENDSSVQHKFVDV